MEQETILPEETSLPEEVEQEEVEQDVTAEDEGEQSTDEVVDQAQPEDDSEEVEFNGKHVKLPKDVAADLRSMQKDYTQKNQANAEQRKALEAQAQFHQDNIKEVAKLEAINTSLAEFAQLDWIAVSQQDPAMFQQLAAQQKQLEAKRNELEFNLNAKYQKSTLERQLEEAKLIEQSESEIRRSIKDWSPELDSKLQRFASEKYGFPADSVGEYKRDPRIAKLLHDAYVGDQIIKARTKQKPVQTQAKPATIISGKGAVIGKDPSRMTDAEYSKWRKSG
jgi:hypothetical protein